jgi:hypothetical protein
MMPSGFSAVGVVLIAVVALAALVLLRGQGARHQAVRRLGLVAFAGLAIVAIVFPDALTVVANAVGVGRGADLVLYLLVVVFFSYVATRFVRDKRQDAHLTLLARRQALAEAPPPRDP